MPDIGSALHILGRIFVFVGAMMLLPFAVDMAARHAAWPQFLTASGAVMLLGLMLSIATDDPKRRRLGLREAWLLTGLVWISLPAISGLPLMIGAPHLSFTDAYFEATSGYTTTGYTVITGLEALSPGVLLWRGLLNWMGGLGIVFIAMMFLPVMRVGGMQFFRTEGFDTLGKILPRAGDISRALVVVYVLITVGCILGFLATGMGPLDAVVHAMACIATGGFGNYDANFAVFGAGAQYVATVFMLAGAMPLIRYVQLLRGSAGPLWRDPQVRGLLKVFVLSVLVTGAWRVLHGAGEVEPVMRSTAFNLTSILTGTGFGTEAVMGWGPFPLVVAFILGAIGGCTGSTSGALSIFRWQVCIALIRSQIQRLYSPHRIEPPVYDGKPITEEVIEPLIFYFTGYVLISGVSAQAIAMTGVDLTSSIFAVWSAIGNIGFSIGPLTARTGTMIDFNDLATWIMSIDMLMGRIGLLAVLVIFLPRFWRD